MATPQEYVNAVLGKAFDEDGVYGAQCVDGFKHFCRTQLGLKLGSICDPTGYATSIWDNYEKLGLDKYFDKVRGDSMVDGDWAIWEMNSKSCPYSHVAMFRRDNNNNIGIFLGQNQLSHPEFTQIGIYYNGIRGALRPKIYHPQPAPIIPDVARDKYKDQIQVLAEKLRVRKEPNTNSEVVGFAKQNGFYNYYESKDNNGNKWYRINDNQWIASKEGEWTKLYPAEPKPTEPPTIPPTTPPEEYIKLKILDRKDGNVLVNIPTWIKE